MQLSLSKNELRSYVSRQLNGLFPDNDIVDFNIHDIIFDAALERLDFCFKRVSHKRYNRDGETFLNHLYADQYLVFIWILSNAVWKEKGHTPLCNKLYYLNKALHGFDCMYDTKLPSVFLVFHGAGTMLGKAEYGDFFVVFQGCTVGAHHGKYPKLANGVTLTANSSIVGDCTVGEGVSISVGMSIFKTNILPDTVVYLDQSTGTTILRHTETSFAQQFFNVNIRSPKLP